MNYQEKKNISETKTKIDQKKIRRKKLDFICSKGFNFPNKFKPTISVKKIIENYNNIESVKLKENNVAVKVAGRIIRQRFMGKAAFIVLKQGYMEIQIYITQQIILSNKYIDKFKDLDLGDIIGVKGILFRTKTKELSIYCKDIELLTKSLRPFPNKYHGLLDQETRYRKRYLDLISNKKIFTIFETRSNIISKIRSFMKKNKFLEVETPMIQTIPGGADARPFITHHNTLNMNMYLRISPELYLKRLIVGGFNRIFEINKNFRNEGISNRHSPEFTMMELYSCFDTYKEMMIIIEQLIKELVCKISKKKIITYGKNEINFKTPYKKISIKNAILKYNPNINSSDLESLSSIKKISKKLNIEMKEDWMIGKFIIEIFEKTVEKKIIQPTFITEYPIEVSLLARKKNSNKNIAERFEFFIAGYEIANGFSELNDAIDQKKRFKQQINKKNIDKSNIFFYDEDYIKALEYGLPPTAGLGLGIDRLIMLLTNQKNIRDVILFPILKNISEKK
ncbi:lysine--tRNA ligase [Buchnera aphidicola (Mindarus keteleerifoliae)]|uniref:lysine--tRNA ligase n=1 Tax=Buchnera aphidicola TaxID=9 RepID=UPI0031B6ACEF